MLALHTPQSGMDMELNTNTKKWQFKYVHPSVTLNHYEKYGIYEVHRSPMHLDNQSLTTDMLSNDQVNHLVQQGVEMMRVNVGAYISILCHIESISAQSH
jgi:1,4-alpha-glucan branching enzyme